MTNTLKKMLASLSVSVVIFTGVVACGSSEPEYTRADCKKAVTKVLMDNLDEILSNPDMEKADKPKECANISDAEGEALVNEIIGENIDTLIEKGFEQALEDESLGSEIP